MPTAPAYIMQTALLVPALVKPGVVVEAAHMFVFGPSLLFIGTLGQIVQTTFTAIVGVVCLSAGLSGYLISRAALWERALLFIAALVLIKPGLSSDLIGLALIVVAVAGQLVTGRKLREQQSA